MKFPADVEVFVATEPIDLRWSFDRLAGCVQERIGRSPKGGALFVFFGRRSSERIKILFYDRGGFCLFYKRLDRGTFTRPAVGQDASSVLIDTRELDILLQGLVLPEKKRRVH